MASRRSSLKSAPLASSSLRTVAPARYVRVGKAMAMISSALNREPSLRRRSSASVSKLILTTARTSSWRRDCARSKRARSGSCRRRSM